MEGKLMATNFITFCVILFVFSTTDVNGAQICRSGRLYGRKTCYYPQYCCGLYNDRCCSTTSFRSNSSRDSSIAELLVIIVIAVCLLCIWGYYECCCKSKSSGVMYNRFGKSQLPAQHPTGVPSAMKTPHPGEQVPHPPQCPPTSSSNVPPYPPLQPLYPAPYPLSPTLCPPNLTPYPSNPTPYPSQDTLQTLSPSGLETLYPPQGATNPYFKMPPPGHSD